MAEGQIANLASPTFPASQNRRGGLSMTSEGANAGFNLVPRVTGFMLRGRRS
jgi:hypothetical protein